ncbi:response regulator transcription factor [Serratia marcescens]|uniref:response regulator transcription factor n=1 Tax=Serratia marcescens TaxID=615 RepID=UPI003CC81875
MLTPREHQVLRCMSCGLTASRVAWVLKITEKTVSAHKRSAMRKLGFRRSGELYQWLLRGGLEYEKRALS